MSERQNKVRSLLLKAGGSNKMSTAVRTVATKLDIHRTTVRYWYSNQRIPWYWRERVEALADQQNGIPPRESILTNQAVVDNNGQN